ncbi:MAG: hypothetical protein OWR52_10205 [Acidibacillus sp.]|nr:hypothetical protein [Acidibacillus sp.]
MDDIEVSLNADQFEQYLKKIPPSELRNISLLFLIRSDINIFKLREYIMLAAKAYQQVQAGWSTTLIKFSGQTAEEWAEKVTNQMEKFAPELLDAMNHWQFSIDEMTDHKEE